MTEEDNYQLKRRIDELEKKLDYIVELLASTVAKERHEEIVASIKFLNNKFLDNF
jgi:tetrahydromethanopterin S-methyltransferase subunit G